MKIGQTPDVNAALAPAGAQKQVKNPPAGAAVAKESAAATSGVPVTVSAFARALDKISQANSDFNADKVKAVRSAIDRGTYKVDAEAIADKLLSNAEEVLGRKKE